MIYLQSKIIAIILCLVCIAGCKTDKLEYEQMENSVSIDYLKSLCRTQTAYIDEDISISGRVTANDWLGEYYKSIVIEDESGGIEIAIDGFNLYEQIPIDSRATVLCCGLALGRSGGKIELGAAPTGEYSVDGIAKSAISRYIIINPVPQERKYSEITISEISAAHISKSVKIKGLQIESPQCQTWCESINGESVNTEHIATDSEGNRLKIRLRGSCHYANTPLVKGRFTVCGIIDYAADEYYIRPTNFDIAAE